ncbi:hypothetical protein E0L36_15510 [Streptomyces sp. AJS327]|uniref:hypothetical protein n=1 Tax=Streptomyces sp. AJS327 TaxID=2545265 RepID=UPI0015DEC4F6|nr:hypothetical protein [Streptomyces sp. AJS327]MBA0052261.1 hypothetical protein [Streptomyces sp. AJS327]
MLQARKTRVTLAATSALLGAALAFGTPAGAAAPGGVPGDGGHDPGHGHGKIHCTKERKIDKRGGSLAYKHCYKKHGRHTLVRMDMRVRDTRHNHGCAIGRARSAPDSKPGETYLTLKACGRGDVKKGHTRWMSNRKIYPVLHITR